jgi:phage-related protein
LADIKSLNYAIDFNINDKGLKEAAKAEKQIDDNLKKAAASSSTLTSSINNTATSAKGAASQTSKIDNNLKNAANSGKDLNKRLDDSFKKASSIGKGLTLGVTVPLLGAAAASFKFASDFNESLNKVEVSFGNNADSIKEWSKTTLNTFGLAQGTSLDMAAFFGDMGTSMGINTKEASTMSRKLVGLAADLSSFKNIGIDQATTALSGIFTGETESIKQLGYVMTQTNLEEYARSKGIKKSMKDMTQQEQVLLRYSYILDRSRNAQGDFARTSDNAANQMRIFKESTKELAATMGQNLLPIITPVIKDLNSMLKKFGNLSPTIQKNILIIGGIVAAIGPLIFIVSKVVLAFMAVSKAVAAAGGIMAILTNPVFLVIAAIAALIGIMIYAYKTNDEFRNAMNNLFKAMQDFGKFFMEYLWPSIKSILLGLWAMVKDIFNDIILIIQGVIEVFSGLITFLVGVFTGDWEKAWLGVKQIFKGIVDAIKGMLLGVIDLGRGVVNTAIGWANNIPGVEIPLIGKLDMSAANAASSAIDLNNIPAYASGTMSAAGGVSLVGERGPELVNLNRGSQVFNADETQSMFSRPFSGNKTINLKIDSPISISLNGGGDTTSTASELERTLEQKVKNIFQKQFEILSAQLGY